MLRVWWEELNETKWKKVDKDGQQHVLDAFQDLAMEDTPPEEEDKGKVVKYYASQSEYYSSDESEDDLVVRDNDGNVNSRFYKSQINSNIR